VPVSGLGYGLAVLALRAGGSADDLAAGCGSWLLGEEVTVRGDWAIAGQTSLPEAVVRVRQRLYPRHRRHRLSLLALRELDLGDDAVAWARLDGRPAVTQRRVGASTRQRGVVALQAPDL